MDLVISMVAELNRVQDERDEAVELAASLAAELVAAKTEAWEARIGDEIKQAQEKRDQAMVLAVAFADDLMGVKIMA